MPRGFGGTGGMVHDDDGTIVAYAISGSEMRFWTATDAAATDWKPSPTAFRACCNDPIVWKAAGRWYATSAQHGAGAGASAGAVVLGNYVRISTLCAGVPPVVVLARPPNTVARVY